MVRILFYKRNHVINSSGGAEKILISYANMLTKRGHEVILATRDEVKGKTFFPLDTDVTFKQFDFSFSNYRRLIGKTFEKIGVLEKFPNFNREFLISNMIKKYCDEVKPDVIIVCSIQELVDFVAYADYDCPVIMMLHGYPTYYFKKGRMNLYSKCLNKVDAIQVLLPSYIEKVPQIFKGKIKAIGNPVYKMKAKQGCNNTIVYMARIVKSKQHHLLIEAFSKIAHKHPDWQVHLYGSQHDTKYVYKCKEMIKNLNLEKQVFFMGETKDVANVLQKCDICAFPSEQEGFSLALTEAMASSIPTIGFDYCTAINELIKDGINGFLAKDVDDFADKLDLLISDEKLRIKLGSEACKVSEEYSPESIMQQWEDFINEVTSYI